jgi:general secretion pathway protein A
MKLIFKTSRGRREVTPEPLHRRIVLSPSGEESNRSLLRVDLLDAYKSFFKFTLPPFSMVSNPKFFFFSSSAAEALNHLRYGIYEGLGFTMITGEPGTGKTMLLRYFLSKAGGDLQTIQISNPCLSRRDFLLAILESLEVSRHLQRDFSERKLTQLLFDLLISSRHQSKRVVIFLDEAQGLGGELLEGLRLLSNLETEEQKLIQIVLLAQTELEERLQERGLRQLDQRILVRYRLLPLKPEEIQPYVEHQLKVADLGTQVEFTSESLNKIYEISQGVPRMVNVLCERAMMSTFVENNRKITMQSVLEGQESLRGMRTPERKGL